MPESEASPSSASPTDGPAEVARLLEAAAAGDAGAFDGLLPMVYERLHAIANQRMASEAPGHTLQATALVHEAYIRLVGPRHVGWNGQAHFYHAAAEAMRRILVDYARAKRRLKRGGGDAARLDIDAISGVADLAAPHSEEQVLALDGAFRRLEEHDHRFAAVVRLRFYAGLTAEQTAASLGLSERTVHNYWGYARAWLARELRVVVHSETPPGLASWAG